MNVECSAFETRNEAKDGLGRSFFVFLCFSVDDFKRIVWMGVKVWRGRDHDAGARGWVSRLLPNSLFKRSGN
jgi:hypothetical protein